MGDHPCGSEREEERCRVKGMHHQALKLGLILSVTIGAAAFLSSGLRSALVDAYLFSIGSVTLLALVRTTHREGSCRSFVVKRDRSGEASTRSSRYRSACPDARTGPVDCR